ncbi:hypothetical protein Cgig2_024522 [Carnegiea gigantea]|uniref:Disease resistance R13L4/SHOC-2-like LRR domain-containing protein n=1 Tax=Carnegiea gigantea TaxID=171969 RepID=A0A9Q1GKA2_9CARY|nr:hypothetical protein Cgig2_024522 [Carnegiea gigantea]
MVQVVSRDVMRDIKMCKLHDLMRDKWLQIAKDENFLLTNDSIRRLAIYVGASVKELESLANSTKLPHSKSLLLFRSGLPYSSLPRSIASLIYLRYLSSKDTRIAKLPSNIGNLRQLYLPIGYMIEDGKALHLDELTNLEIIEGLGLNTVAVKVLQELNSSLQRLKAICFGKMENLDPLLKSSSIKSMSLKLDGLILLSLPKMLSDCHSLHRLIVSCGNFGDIGTINSRMRPLWGCQFSEDAISVLGKITRLKKLLLIGCRNKLRLHISSNGFPELTHLVIRSNHGLEECTIERERLPKLLKLEIEGCPRITKIPDALPLKVSIICDTCVPVIEKYGSWPHYIRKHAC